MTECPDVHKYRSEPNIGRRLEDEEDSPRKYASAYELGTLPRRLTVTPSADPEFLEELKKRHREFLHREGKEVVALQESDLDAAFGSHGSWAVRAALPEAGWLYDASEQPFARRDCVVLPSDGGVLKQANGTLGQLLAKDWGTAVMTAKGCKGAGDCTLGQDNFCVACLMNGWKMHGVFDGHGLDGHWPAERAARTMPVVLQQAKCAALLDEGDVPAALRHAFKVVEEDLEAAAAQQGRDMQVCGCTATVALTHPSRDSVWVATVGDSRAVLLHPEQGVLQETLDHKPLRKDEADRIERFGGTVNKYEYPDGLVEARVAPKGLAGPQIAVSRSFGDLLFKEAGVIAEPEVVTWSLQGREGAYLLACSDGIWEFLSASAAQEVIQDCITSGCSAEQALEVLLRHAQKQWKLNEGIYCDDIAIVLAALGTPASLPIAPEDDAEGCVVQ